MCQWGGQGGGREVVSGGSPPTIGGGGSGTRLRRKCQHVYVLHDTNVKLTPNSTWEGPCQSSGLVVILGAMEAPRKPLAKIEGRKRMQASGLTVAWHGTRSLKDWAAYVENGSKQGRLVLADQVSERAVKSLLARIQTLSRDDLEAMGRPVQVVAAQGGGAPVRRPRRGGEASPTSEIIVQSVPGRQLALSRDTEAEAPGAAPSRRRRLPAPVDRNAPAATRRPARASTRDLGGTVRQLRARLESLEDEQEQLRAELALLRGDAEAYEGTPSIFVTGWFRATLVLIVLAIAVVITVPWLMDLFEGGAREPRPPVRTEAPAASPSPTSSGR